MMMCFFHIDYLAFLTLNLTYWDSNIPGFGNLFSPHSRKWVQPFFSAVRI